MGATSARPIDVRFCASTHIDLETAVVQGRFRPDLLALFAGHGVHVPSLRHRLEEIPPLVAMWLERRAVTAGAPFVEALLLREYSKNLRELRQTVGKSIAAAARACGEPSPTRELGPDDVPPVRVGASTLSDAEPCAPSMSDPREIRDDRVLGSFLRTQELSATARELGHGEKTVRRVLEAHGIDL